MSVAFFVLVVRSIVDTVPSPELLTRAVLPFDVTATPNGCEPTVMSSGFLVLVFTSMVDTVTPPLVGDQGALAVRRDRYSGRVGADGDVVGVLGPWSSHRSSRPCRWPRWSRRRSCRPA